MLKEATKVGMQVRILKLDKTNEARWTSNPHESQIGLKGTVRQIHTDLPAIKVEIPDSLYGEKRIWYHVHDLQVVDNEHLKQVKQEVNFDPINLVVGV